MFGSIWRRNFRIFPITTMKFIEEGQRSRIRVTYGIILILNTVQCNKSRRQLRATRQTCSRIYEDGFPFPGSLRRHGRAAHPAARKVREFAIVGLRDVLSRLFSRDCTATSPPFCLFALNYSKSHDHSPARDKTSITFLDKCGNFVRDVE